MKRQLLLGDTNMDIYDTSQFQIGQCQKGLKTQRRHLSHRKKAEAFQREGKMGEPKQKRPAGRSRMRRWKAYCLAIGLTFGSIASAIPAMAQGKNVTLTVASFQPEHQAMSAAMKDWAAEVARRSNGRIKFNFFWQGSLLKATEVARGVQDGRADIGLSGAVYLPAQLPLSTIDTMPFMTPNVAAVNRTILDLYKESTDFRKEYERNKIILLGYMPVSVNLFFTKSPLPAFENLKNLRIRTAGLAVTALAAGGASPVALPQDQVFESLQRGLLDGTFGAGIDLGLDFNFQTLAPNITEPNYGVWASGAYFMNKSVYEALDPEAKAIFDELMPKFIDYYLPVLKKTEDSRCDKIKADPSIKLTVWPTAETEKWKAALADAARQQWIKSAADKGVDGAAFLADYEKRVRAYEKTEEWSSPISRCLAR